MFVEKLNKKQDGVYVIEEEKTITDGKWEGFLDHDNVNHESIAIYTGSKFTGEKVENYFISTPSETPWKTYLKVFSESEKIYITYESKGDQVEAEDINLVQESIIDTRTELEQYKVANDNIVGNLDTRLVTVENGKAEKTYVDTELMKKADKSNTYTKTEVDAALSGKVDKVEGKGLSTNDYTNADKAKVENLPENTNAELALKANAAAVESALSDKADTSYVIANLEALNTSKADKSSLAETNRRVAEIGKDLSDYKAALSQLNPNQEAKQTISDYGIVPLPVNAANGHMDVAVGGNTEINENGMQHTVSAMRIVSESEDKSQRTELYIPDYGELRSVPNGTADEISGGQLIQRVKTIAITANAIRGLGTAGVNVDWVVISKPTDYIGYGTSAYATGTIIFGNYTEKRISTLDLPENINCISSFGPETFYLVIPKGTYADLNAAKTALAGTKLTYQLAEPIITPINVSGTLLSYPKGTVYFEPVLPVAGIYTANGISVTNTDFPIESIERIYKIDFATGVETPIDVSKVVVAGNGLGFTHPDLADGDIVFFTYYYNAGTQPKISATYFDSRYVLKDTVTGKFYKKVETVQNGQLVTQLVEVS